MPRPLVVKVTAGADDAERCNQGFTVAATAVAAGADVSLWLTGEAAWFGVPGRAEAFTLPHAQPLADLLAAVLAGGRVTVCSQCAVRRGLVEGDLLYAYDMAAVGQELQPHTWARLQRADSSTHGGSHRSGG